MKWWLGAIALLLAAMALQLGLLAYAMYALLAMMIVSRLLARTWIENLTATRECNRTSAEIGEQVAVVVTLQNTGALPIAWAIVEDLLPRAALVQRPPRLRVSGKRLAVVMLPGRGRRTLYYQLKFEMRGYYQVGPAVLETGDLFGLHRRWRVASEPNFILVYPKVVPLVGFDLASRRPIGEVRLTHRLFEDPTRVAGVRLYQAGDPLNRVHWRATARTGELHSKIYEPSCVAGATILLDFHIDGFPRRHEPIGSELCVTTAASLANAVYQMGQQIGLATNGRDAADRIRQEGWRDEYSSRFAAQRSAAMQDRSERLRPVVVGTRRGPEQLRRILETLARVEMTDGLRFPELVQETESQLPPDATVVAVVADVPPETAWALGNLRRQGFAVTAILASFDENHLLECSSRLVAERIDFRVVNSEASLAAVCQQHALAPGFQLS